jgi:hypothetical protein
MMQRVLLVTFFISLLLFIPVMQANQLGLASSRNSQASSGVSNAVLGSPPTVRISPESITVLQVDDNFTVYVTVDNVIAVGAAQVQLTYDPTVLNVTEVAEGSFLQSAGPTAVAQSYAEENLQSQPPKGEVYYSSAIIGTGALTGASGSGVLLNVTFRVVSVRSSVLHLLSYDEGTGGSGTYFIHLNSDLSQVEVIPNLEDGSYGSTPAYSLTISTSKNGVPVTSNVTLFDENRTVIQRANDVLTHNWLLAYGTLYVQAVISQNGFVYTSERIQANLTHNTELAIDFQFGNLTVSCLDTENRPLKNCTLIYSMGDVEQTRYSDNSGSDTFEAYYGNWTIRAYWMGVLVGGANINVNQPQVSLSLQNSVGDFTVLTTDQYGHSTEANVTLRNDAYNLTQSGYIREPLENVTFTLIPLIGYNLTISSSSFGTQSYIVYTGQTRQIQIETLPGIQKVFYIIIGAVPGIATGSLAVWIIARRRRKSIVK